MKLHYNYIYILISNIMSKSNIKNINSIFIKKESTIAFNKSTYENLLFKLKKSII